MRKFFLSALVAATAFAAVPAAAATTVNTCPSVPWGYGTGNNYTPCNTLVTTLSDGSTAYLRFHQNGVVAPASDASGAYSFALGTSPLNFDFGVTSSTGSLAGLSLFLTLTDLGTGQVGNLSFVELIPDNYKSGGTVQNSEQWGFFLPYNANLNDTYQVTLSASRFVQGQGTTQLGSATAQAILGSGAAVPEPATWAMMLLGFGAIGFQMRRKRNPGLLQIA